MNHLSHVYCCNGPLLNLRMPFTNEIVCFRYFIQHLNVSKTLWTYSVHRDHFSEIIFLGLILGKDLVQSCLPPPLPPAWYHPPPAIEQLKSASVLYIHSSYPSLPCHNNNLQKFLTIYATQHSLILLQHTWPWFHSVSNHALWMIGSNKNEGRTHLIVCLIYKWINAQGDWVSHKSCRPNVSARWF